MLVAPPAFAQTASLRGTVTDSTGAIVPGATVTLTDPGTKATIESRSGVKDGFAMTIVVNGPPDPKQPRRETYVVRQLGSGWYQCVSEWIPDDAFRDQVIALCKSLKL